MKVYLKEVELPLYICSIVDNRKVFPLWEGAIIRRVLVGELIRDWIFLVLFIITPPASNDARNFELSFSSWGMLGVSWLILAESFWGFYSLVSFQGWDHECQHDGIRIHSYHRCSDNNDQLQGCESLDSNFPVCLNHGYSFRHMMGTCNIYI